MRVTFKALASLTALPLLLASCVTPPPMSREAPRYAAAPSSRATPPVRGGEAVPATYRQDRYGDRRREPAYGYEDDYDDRGRYSPPTRARLSLLLGRRSIDDEAFAPTDEPGVFAFEFNQVPEPGGIGFEFGLGFGYDQEDNAFVPGIGTADLELNQAEIYAGVRAEFGQGQIRPYIGGGGTFMSARTTLSQGFLESEDDDTTFGGYVHGGIQADINESFFIGVDYRHVFGGEYDFGGTSVDSDYDQLAIVLGFNL